MLVANLHVSSTVHHTYSLFVARAFKYTTVYLWFCVSELSYD